MSLHNLQLDDDTLQLIDSIKLKVELFERQIFRPHKSIDQLVSLLQTASKSSHSETQLLFQHFASQLSKEKHIFFKTLGIDLEKPEPQKAPKPAETSAKMTPNNTAEKKKKIMYRGQVKYV